jgi:flagellar basal-body rod modification protein FlgD
MSAIATDPYSSIGLSPPPKEESSRKGSLGQSDFLKLMTTQLMNQDPMAPMQNGEFLGQMAQFSTVSGIQSLQASFEKLATALQTNRVLEASTMVGKKVLVEADHAELGSDGAGLKGVVEVPEGVSTVQLTLHDARGAVARQLTLDVGGTGPIDFSWDGLLQDGTAAPAGGYTVSAMALVNGQNTQLTTRLALPVVSASIADDGVVLNTSKGSVRLADVTRIFT